MQNETLQNTIDRLNAAEDTARQYSPVTLNAAGRIKKQTFKQSRLAIIDGEPWRVTVTARFDDECGNGHETFAITGDAYGPLRVVDGEVFSTTRGGSMGGCIHEIIAAAYPELAPVIKWHLTSTGGPMHYKANTLYHARDTDYNGRRAGEVSSWSHGLRFGNSPVTYKASEELLKWMRASLDAAPGLAWRYEERPHVNRPGDNYNFKPKYTLTRGGEAFGDTWYNASFDTKQEAEEITQALNELIWEPVRVPSAYSEGKARELDAARSCAVWPDATDAELMAPDLADRLDARLPALLAEFKRDVKALGFNWPADLAASIETTNN